MWYQSWPLSQLMSEDAVEHLLTGVPMLSQTGREQGDLCHPRAES